ncbi:MAG TPA: sulfotransferase [Vicinamibacterales bacterium]|nr:sulfotransferase [Vicinamibacterales bacterium]
MSRLLEEPTVQPARRTEFSAFYEKTRDEPVYVILGVQGSGTNLLGRLLTRLFNFSVMRDRSSVFKAAARLGNAPDAEAVEREIRRFTNLVSPSAVRRKTSKDVIRKNVLFRGVEAELEPSRIRSGADFARLIYAYRAFSLGATHVAIKSDDLWESIQAIDTVLPNRRVILLTRDFRDNLVSVSGKQFGPIEPVCAAAYVKGQVAHYAAEYRRAGRAGYHVKYETVLNDTRRFVEGFAGHFAIAPSVNLDVAIPALQFRPNKIGKWKALPPRQLAWCEGILQEELREFGYPFASIRPERPGRRQLLVAAAKDKVKRVPQKVRRVLKRIRS